MAHRQEPDGADRQPQPASSSNAAGARPRTKGAHVRAAKQAALDRVLSRAQAARPADGNRRSVVSVKAGSTVQARREEKRAVVLHELERCPVLGYAARAAGIHPDTLTDWRKADPAFDRAVVAALELGIDRLEAETYGQALERASQGNPTHLLKMFLLKSRRREVYGERLEVSSTTRHEIVIDLVPADRLPAGPELLVIEGQAERIEALPAGELELDRDGDSQAEALP